MWTAIKTDSTTRQVPFSIDCEHFEKAIAETRLQLVGGRLMPENIKCFIVSEPTPAMPRDLDKQSSDANAASMAIRDVFQSPCRQLLSVQAATPTSHGGRYASVREMEQDELERTILRPWAMLLGHEETTTIPDEEFELVVSSEAKAIRKVTAKIERRQNTAPNPILD